MSKFDPVLIPITIDVYKRQVIDRAKVAGVNREIIDRAINKAKGGSDENYDFIRYEGYGPNGAAVIVDTLTDNVNRTVAVSYTHLDVYKRQVLILTKEFHLL